MRLSPIIAAFLKQLIQDAIPGSAIYLFGSRVDDEARGGDIDLMILSDDPVDKSTIRKIRVEFIKKFGWRKLDIVHFTFSSDSAFRKLIDINCISL